MTITSDADGAATLRAVETPGRFRVDELTEQSATESRGGKLIRRIVFTPSQPAARMTLTFALRIG